MEALQGFWVVDVENESRAVDIAAQISEAADTRIEVRECADAPPGRRCGDPRLTTSTLAFGRNSRERDVSQLDPRAGRVCQATRLAARSGVPPRQRQVRTRVAATVAAISCV